VTIPREQWEYYYLYNKINLKKRYLEILDLFLTKISTYSKLNELNSNIGFLYKLIFRKANGDAN
jgi:hypothetical protein